MADRRFHLSASVLAVFYIICSTWCNMNLLNIRHIGEVTPEDGDTLGDSPWSRTLAYVVVYIRRCESHGIRVVGWCYVEIVVEIYIGTVEQGIFAVVRHNLLNVSVVEPSALIVSHCSYCLGIELLVVDGFVGVDGTCNVNRCSWLTSMPSV